MIDALVRGRLQPHWSTNRSTTFRFVGIVLLSIAVATSSLSVHWIASHQTSVNSYPEFAGIILYISDVPLLVGLVVWAIGWYFSRPLRLHDGPRYVALPLLAILVLSAASLFWANDTGVAGYTVFRRLVLFALYVVLVTESRKALVAVAIAIGAVALVHTSVGLLQLTLGHAVGLTMLGEIPKGFLDYWAVGNPQAFGVGFNPNPVGLHLAAASTLAYGFYLLYPGGRFMRAVALFICLSAFLGMLTTLSRSAPMGWLIGVIVVSSLAVIGTQVARSVLLRRMAVAVAIVASIVVIGVVGAERLGGPAGAFEFQRFTSDYVISGIRIRIRDYKLSFPVIREHVARGVGAGNYPQAVTDSMPPAVRTIQTTPVHNVFLLSLAELGLIGTIAWAAIVVSPVVWLVRNRRTFYFDTHSIIAVGPLLVVLFESFVDFTPFATQDGRVLMWGLLGIWAGTLVASRARADRDESVSEQAEAAA